MVERHIVSPEFISDRRGKAVLISEDESISIMINEEDHLRIQVLREGPLPQGGRGGQPTASTPCSARTLGLRLRQRVRLPDPVPHQPGHGPAGLGDAPPARLDGKRAPCPGCPPTSPSWGLTLRGTYGEGSKITGALYQLSNQITLGLSESEAVENLRAITVQLMEEERKARSQMSENIAWQDKIDRAAGILKTARVLSSSECMELLSYIRLGLSTGVLQGVTTQELNALMVNAQPATLMAKAGKQLDQNQRDILRAQMAREACAKIKE